MRSLFDRFRSLTLVLIALIVVSAAPNLSPDELVRQGNAAFAREEYDLALQLYTKAEDGTTNPGLVSFNKGTALYRLNKFRDAQLHFQRCLEDADPNRRPLLQYNLGNCLLHQAQAGTDLNLYREAINQYERCVQDEATSATLRENARYNLELTKLLWLQARINRPDKDPPPNAESPEEPPRPETKHPETMKTEDGTDPNPSMRPNPGDKNDKRGQIDEKRGKQTPIQTDQTAPGRGNLPPPSDTSKLNPLAPEDAQKSLEIAAERIRRERSAYMQRTAPSPARAVPDW